MAIVDDGLRPLSTESAGINPRVSLVFPQQTHEWVAVGRITKLLVFGFTKIEIYQLINIERYFPQISVQ